MADLKKEMEGMRRTFNLGVGSGGGSGKLPWTVTPTTLSPPRAGIPNWLARSCDAAEMRSAQAVREPSEMRCDEPFHALGRRIGIATYRAGLSGPRRRSPAHRGPGRASGLRQDHHAGEIGGELRPGARRPVLLLSMDNYRVAAGRAIALLCRHPGCRLSIVETVAALAQAIEENRGKELISHRHSGTGAAETVDYPRLGAIFGHRHDIDTHLAVPVSDEIRRSSRVVDSLRNLPARID